MKKLILLTLLYLPIHAFSQIDSAFIKRIRSLDTTDMLKTDTLAVPEDALTKKIRQLRHERKGLTIETVIMIKLKEEQAKDTLHGPEYFESLQKELTTGHTGRLLANSAINLYRNSYTESEIDELIAFYKTPAGKKMDSEQFLLMVRSVKDAEQLMERLMKKK